MSAKTKLSIMKALKLAVDTGNVDAINEASSRMVKYVKAHKNDAEFFAKFTKTLLSEQPVGMYQIEKKDDKFLVSDNGNLLDSFDSMRQAQNCYPSATVKVLS